MAESINRWLGTGNLTRDPELRQTGGGTSVCNLRIAVNSRVKVQGEWTDKPNYFDVAIFGAQADACARFLAKGRPVAIDGRLDWREWEGQDGQKRQAVQIIADSVQFLNSGQDRSEDGPASPTPAPATAAAVAADPDDDIPF